ncbi:MAG: DUF342 domain-containing protein [Candidatus Schekmanbacteria bacterium]|nr:DUF342 domain-containing protein [Candidatus Schekmanbacteria bacterium]
MTAVIDCLDPGSPRSDPISPDEVYAELARLGVCHGIDHQAIQLAVSRTAQHGTAPYRIVVARGTPATPGWAGEVTLCFDSGLLGRGQEQAVVPGQILARVRPGAPGSSGVTVIGAYVAPTAPEGMTLEAGAGVVSDTDGVQTTYRAAAYGFLYVTDRVLSVNPTVRISANELEVRMDLQARVVTAVPPRPDLAMAPSTSPAAPAWVSAAEIVATLHQHGVTFGIDEGEIARSLESSRLFGRLVRDVVVARGRTPQSPDRPAFLLAQQYLNDSGSPDLAGPAYPWPVVAGDVVAADLPQSFREGCSVRGTPIPHAPAEAPAADGAGLHRDAEGRWIVDRRGVLLVHGASLRVSEELVLTGALFAPATLSVEASLRIVGAVEDDVFIKVGGDCIIEGDVGNAFIEARGNVVVRGEVRGTGECRLRAGQSIIARSVADVELEARGDILIHGKAVSARLRSGGSVTIAGEPGLLSGGCVDAVRGVCTVSLDCGTTGVTRVRLGLDSEKAATLADLRCKVAAGFKLSSRQRRELDLLEAASSHSGDINLTVLRSLGPDLQIQIGEHTRRVTRPLCAVMFAASPRGSGIVERELNTGADKAQASTAAPATTAAAMGTGTGAGRALIADASRFSRSHLGAILKRQGWKVIGESATAEETREIAEITHPDVIFLDLALPGEPAGLGLVRELRRRFSASKIWVMGTGIGDDGEVASLAAGAGRVLHKPFEAPIIAAALHDGGSASALPAALNSELAGSPHATAAAGRRRTVLVVEDDLDCREAIRALLEADDLEVVVSGTAERAMRLIATRCPDLMLLDLDLPGMPGESLLRWLRFHSARPDLPAIIVSGRVTKNAVSDITELGVSACLTKPIDPARLRSTVNRTASPADTAAGGE